MRRRTLAGTASAPVGAVLRLTDVRLDPAVGRRLAELGVRRGSELTILGRTAGNGRVIGVGTCRIALDRETVGALETVPADTARA